MIQSHSAEYSLIVWTLQHSFLQEARLVQCQFSQAVFRRVVCKIGTANKKLIFLKLSTTYDSRLLFSIPWSMTLAPAATIFPSPLDFNSFSPCLQNRPTGIHSSFHSPKACSKLQIWLCHSSVENASLPSCCLHTRVKAFDNFALASLPGFKCITSSLLLTNFPTLSPL